LRLGILKYPEWVGKEMENKDLFRDRHKGCKNYEFMMTYFY
jgi:hypothetical protein